MGELHDWGASARLIQPKVAVRDTDFGSDEHDRLPLKQRLKILLARRKLSDLFPENGSEKDEVSDFSSNLNDDFVKIGDGQADLEFVSAGCSLLEGKSRRWSSEQNDIGEWGDCDDRAIEANVVSPSTVLVDKMKAVDESSDSRSIMSPHSMGMDIMSSGNSSLTSVENYPCGGSSRQKEIEEQKPTVLVDELDHIVLKERQRLLLSSQMCGLTQTSLELLFDEQCKSEQLLAPAVESCTQQSTKTIKVEVFFDDKNFGAVEDHVHGSDKTSVSGSSNEFASVVPCSNNCHDSGKVRSRNMAMIEEKDRVSSSQQIVTRVSADSGDNLLSKRNLSMSKFAGVKLEPMDINETSIQEVSVTPLPVQDMNLVKVECGTPCDFEKDILDHMLLRERMKLLPSYVPCLDIHGMACTGKIVSSAVDCEPIAKETLELVKINRLRKKRKTATDSVETALEEDAPGLLQVLIGKGVSLDEIKLYGQPEHYDALDDLPTEDNFTELEAIISKIFSQPSSLLKLPSFRCMKGEKASYCLACLFSLVEQAQHLRIRKWPVEWGWCRDLQAFIFVFARHNRIVLERPEYGYATYFFELMDSLPISWQITRLVTIMKLTSCSRATLIENRALVVGEDLTEGEAKVLAEYGWTPNTGLGNMLNYCDRVVHDRKAENPAEWRSKIGKLLVDGYNSGCIVAPNVPKKVVEYIKVETIEF